MSGRMWRAAAGIIIGLSLAARAQEPATRPDPAATAAAYEEIAGRLTPGGDLFVVLNMEGVCEQGMSALVELAAAGGAENPAAVRVVRQLHAFLKDQGLYAARGLGMSAVPRADGLNELRVFLAREPEAALRPFWRACVGSAPRPAQALRYLPADTELARAGAAEPAAAWALVRAAVREVAPPEAGAAFEAGLEAAAARLGVTLDELLASIGSDAAFAILLSRETTISVPAGPDGVLALPSPSLLLALRLNDPALPDLIRRQAAELGLPLMETVVEGTTVRSMVLPVPFVPVQLAMAEHDGFFLLGTTVATVEAAIRSAVAGGGLTAREDYRAAFAGQPAANNGMVYASPRFGAFMKDLQGLAMAVQPAAPGESPAARAFVQRLVEAQPAAACAMTVVNEPGGILSAGTSTAGGREMVLSAAMMPLGMAVGIALPAMNKARETARQTACLKNLRLIEAAKQAWAVENEQEDGADVDIEALGDYLPGGVLPACPAGGAYVIGPVGTPPTCDCPGHALR